MSMGDAFYLTAVFCCSPFFFIPALSPPLLFSSHPFYLISELNLFSFSFPLISALILSLCHCLLSVTPLTD